MYEEAWSPISLHTKFVIQHNARFLRMRYAKLYYSSSILVVIVVRA